MNAPLRFAPLASSTAVSGGPRRLLQLEGLVMLVGGTLAFSALGGSWAFFFLAFLVPDLSLLAYLAGPKAGAAVYNTAHALLGPAVLLAIGWWLGAPMAVQSALIWVAHVGFDRMLGYGLKYASAFGDTHLGRVGKHAAPSEALA